MNQNHLPSVTAEADEKTLKGLSVRLKALLSLPSGDEAKSEIAGSKELLDEVRHALPALRRYAQQPAGEAGVRAVIANAFGTYAPKDRSEGEWKAFWLDYTDALEDVPRGALEAGMREWKRKSDSMRLPFPGELRQLARSTPNTAAEAYTRAYYASLEANSAEPDPGTYVRTATAPQGFVRTMPSQSDRDYVAERAAAFRKAHEASKPPIMPMRPTHGDLAEGHHITPQLLAMTKEREPNGSSKS